MRVLSRRNRGDGENEKRNLQDQGSHGVRRLNLDIKLRLQYKAFQNGCLYSMPLYMALGVEETTLDPLTSLHTFTSRAVPT